MLEPVKTPQSPFKLFVAIMVLTVFLSAYQPINATLWFAHSITVLVALVVLVATHKRFAFSPLVYFLMWVYGTAMMVGAHFTYEQEPLFMWLQDTFELSRNYYDRFTHFWQGVVPAMIIRELLIRHAVVVKCHWLPVITIALTFAISAAYELFEWWFALLSGKTAEISLGMQGDVWDTQWDMLLALIGAVLAVIFLSKLHDKQLNSR